ncbi:FixH family protein [Bradyrhizobium sp. SZCCHNR1015]|uniref:FixH family protein n=1 Tax=Bradyrhizobium sp. SZCCHNR1015 TaxID=3057338 RepID=UPI0029164A1B|nr:FixH family protein [Bradyrhizobium sp. SZCCHNR1015]
MPSRISTAALAATLSLAATAAIAGAADYSFEPVTAEMKKGDDVTVAVRLTHKQTGKAVTDAVIFKTRVDMAPDGMADMVSDVAPLPSREPGVYAFKTDLPMAGRYQVTLSAKVQGEPETVTGKVIVKATK